jgi:hypothetical protein
MRIPAALLACILPAHAVAACDDPEAALRLAYPDAKENVGDLIVAGDYAQRVTPGNIACKVWPFKPELTLLAIPLIEAEPANDGENNGDIEVIVADTRTGKPLARRREKGMAFGDAIQFSGLELDTARYDIASDVRAFGIVTRQFGSSRVNPYSEHALWLYSFSGGHIARVLDGLVTQRLNGENDGNCEGIATEISRTVEMAKAEHQGHRDMIVKQTEKTTVSAPAGDDCKSTEKVGVPKQWTLQFDGKRYRAASGTNDDGVFSYIEIANEP